MSIIILGAGGGSSGGSWNEIVDKPDIFNAMRIYGGTDLDASGSTADTNAQYPIISKSTASTGSIFNKSITDLPKGNYSIMVRMKVSSITSSSNIFKIVATDGSVATTKYIKPNMFAANNTYATFGFTAEHTSDSFSVALSIDTALSGQTVGVDYLEIAPAFTAVSALG